MILLKELLFRKEEKKEKKNTKVRYREKNLNALMPFSCLLSCRTDI